MEIRLLNSPPTIDAGAGNRLVGYAARFNVISEPLTTDKGRVFQEVVRPGTFSASLRSGRPVFALWNHGLEGARPPLGRTPTTLRLTEDTLGLRYEIDLPNWADDVRESVARGDVTGSSFRFSPADVVDRWSWQGDGKPLRELLSVHLIEVSPVILPAYSTTSVSVRSAAIVPDMPPEYFSALARRRLALSDRT